MRNSIVLVTASLLVTSCGTVNEKTAPCKRPANLSSYAADPRGGCGPMVSINDPNAAFSALGIVE